MLIGFFLPGDSLLFTGGILASQGNLNIRGDRDRLFLAAVIGDQVGLHDRSPSGAAALPSPRLADLQAEVRRSHQGVLRQTRAEDHSSRGFVPVVRTFAPVLAGVGEMDRRTFTTYNVVGGFVWAVGVTMAGYLLGSWIGSDIDKYLLPIIAVIVVLSILPPLIEMRRERRRTHAAAVVSAADAEAQAADLREAVTED